MTDDLNKDFFPVRDNFLLETCRSNVVTAMQIDPRERHIVSKLDRSELEDRYLRLQEDYQELKKISNSQQDKIKRLVTKLMRASATPRSCFTGSSATGDRNQMELLEIENSKLKDKIVVLKNQILNHKSLNVSSSNSRKLPVYNSSRPTTYRSDPERLKVPSSQNSMHDREDDVLQNYLSKIQELEIQRKQMMNRIVDLETKLASAQTGNQREKTAENIEYIRVWRQMKLQQDELAESEAKNKYLMNEIEKLKKLLDETSKNEEEKLNLAEKKCTMEIVEKSQDNQLFLREKDEQIRDLTKEMEILQQHNTELINLSINYNQVEIETVELKKKVQEILLENQSLKNSFINEQGNTKALHAANTQLVNKLQDLQKNMDSLTIEFKSLKHQRNRSEEENNQLPSPNRNKLPNQISCPAILSDPESKKIVNHCVCTQTKQEEQINNINCKNPVKEVQFEEVAIQTEVSSSSSNKIDENNWIKSPQKIDSNTQTVCYNNGTEKLSPERMLKLLDDAQITKPLDSQSAIKIHEIDELYSRESKTNRQRQVIALENLLFGNSNYF